MLWFSVNPRPGARGEYCVDFPVRLALYGPMWRSRILAGLLFLLPGPVWAVEAAPALTDREIVERLTRLEEGQQAMRAELGQLRADMDKQLGQLRADMDKQLGQLRADMDKQLGQLRADMDKQIGQLRADMDRQNQRLRDDINAQFDRFFQLLIGLLGTFTALVLATIGFALWDRRTMLRPVEGRVTSLEEEMAGTRPRSAALLEALRALSQRDPELATILKNFNL